MSAFTTTIFSATVLAAAGASAQTFPNCGTSVRRSWRDSTCAERAEYLAAVQAVKDNGVYDEFSAVHFANNELAHNTPNFLPWHRWYLWLFEKQLQEATNSCVTVPYWDWTMDANVNIEQSSVFGPDAFGTKTPDDTVLCVPDGIAAGSRFLDATLDGGEWRHNLPTGGSYSCASFAANPTQFCAAGISGQFPNSNGITAAEACCTCRTAGFPNAGVTVNGQCQEINTVNGGWVIGQDERTRYGLSDTQCLSRQFRSNSVPQYGEVEAMSDITSAATAQYTQYEQALEGTPHALPHNWVGWLMSTHNSPQDPLFWVHHAQVDRLWQLWQDYREHEDITEATVTAAEYTTAEVDTVLPYAGGTGLLNFLTPAGEQVTPRMMVDARSDLVDAVYANDNLARMIIEADPAAGPRFSNEWTQVAAAGARDDSTCAASRPTNPCATNPCDPNTTCTNTDGFAVCSPCPAGMTGHGATGCIGGSNPCDNNNGNCGAFSSCSFVNEVITCVDIDECATNSGDCGSNSVCQNQVDAPNSCTCQLGFESATGANCQDIDECAVGNGGCGDASLWTCVNNVGAAPSCVDRNECQENPTVCGSNSVCSNNVGAAPTCTCNSGFESATGANCQDIDECAQVNNGGCSEFESCVNSAPGFQCVDIDECATANGGCGEFENCIDQVSNAPVCVDINECDVNNGGCGNAAFTLCTNNVNAPPTCSDIDECAFGNGPCNEFTTCVNNVAAGPTCEPIAMCATSYCADQGFPAEFTTCVEMPGFAPQCLDTQECATNNGGCVGTGAACVENAFAAPTCTCAEFYELSGSECVDVDECLTNNGDCGNFMTCSNNVGAAPTCTDINECLNQNGGCAAPLGECVNNVNAPATCSDTNECLVENGGCGSAELFTCVNQVGTEPLCVEIDVCDGIDCGAFASCEVQGTEPVCVDIDECLVNQGGCSAVFETCVNNEFAAQACVDINECLVNNGGCDAAFYTCQDNVRANPTCVPRDLCAETAPCDLEFYTCQNNQGANPTCNDINECASANGGCGAATSFSCTNNVGAAPTCEDITPAEPAWIAMQQPLLNYWNNVAAPIRPNRCAFDGTISQNDGTACWIVYDWFVWSDCRGTGIGGAACLALEAQFPLVPIVNFPTAGAGRRLLSMQLGQTSEFATIASSVSNSAFESKKVSADHMLAEVVVAVGETAEQHQAVLVAKAPHFARADDRSRFVQLRLDYPELNTQEIIAIVADEHCQMRGRANTGVPEEWIQMNGMDAAQFECRFH